MTQLEFQVYGEPAPQGSKRHIGRGILIESSKKVAPWREAVKWAAVEAMKGGFVPSSGPVQVTAVFVVARPKSAPKSRVYPHVKPDIDKLARSTLDALTQAGVFPDDSQVVEIKARKEYVRPDGFRTPGAWITVMNL